MELCSRIINTDGVRMSKASEWVMVMLIRAMRSILGLAITVKAQVPGIHNPQQAQICD